MKEVKHKIIVIVGPTASGKTALSLEVAKAIGGEIISADSRQIYRGLDIGTGKVTKDEMGDIPHHLIDICEPDQVYSAADFARDASLCIEEIVARGKVPIIVGGTFFYIEALLGRKTLPSVSPNLPLREKLESMSDEEVFAILKEKDPRRAETIDAKNKRRVIRAIEIALALGVVPEEKEAASPFDAYVIGIDMPKEILHERIGTRLKERMEIGMLKEAEKLHANGLSFSRMDALGLEYRYLAKHLQGEMTKDEMLQKLETEIRHFAKRQMTWLKKMSDVRWYSLEDAARIISDIRAFLN